MTALTEELLVLARQGTDAFATTPVSLAETAERCWDHVETGDAALVVGPTGPSSPTRAGSTNCSRT